MNLNNIDLPAGLIVALYGKYLIDDTPKAIQPTPAGTTEAVFKSLGNNEKNILIVVQYQEAAHLPDAQLDFLMQLLKACQLSLADVAIVNLNNYENNMPQEILQHFRSTTILLFGVSTGHFNQPFTIPDYQIQSFSGQTWIQAAALHHLQNDKQAKGKLWNSLKIIFQL